MLRPTLQARAGFDPTGFGPGISAPYGYSNAYVGHHNGEDYFWLGKASSLVLGISTEESKRVYPVVDGMVHHIEDSTLGLGLWQQIDAEHRFYWWHLRDRSPAGRYKVTETCGRMGRTGLLAGLSEHLHAEVRRAPYRKSDRVDPAPFFASGGLAGGDGTPIEEDDMPLPLFYVATSDSPSGIVKGNDTWVRSAPGEPLRKLTVGQATDWRSSLGIIDFTSPNLIGKPGTWFDAAFAEDKVVHEANLQAHPWLAAPAGAIGELTVNLTGTAKP